MAGKVLPGSGIGQWAAKTLGEDDGGQDGKQGSKDDKDENPVGADAITVADLLQRPDLPPEVREWLEEYAQRGPEWAVAHNPPNWVSDEALWEKLREPRMAPPARLVAMANTWAKWWCCSSPNRS